MGLLERRSAEQTAKEDIAEGQHTLRMTSMFMNRKGKTIKNAEEHPVLTVKWKDQDGRSVSNSYNVLRKITDDTYVVNDQIVNELAFALPEGIIEAAEAKYKGEYIKDDDPRAAGLPTDVNELCNNFFAIGKLIAENKDLEVMTDVIVSKGDFGTMVKKVLPEGYCSQRQAQVVQALEALEAKKKEKVNAAVASVKA